jgi:protein-S-isoprenylcysteine O-methyltransferase Ste14
MLRYRPVVLENAETSSSGGIGATGLYGVHPAMRPLSTGDDRPVVGQQDRAARTRSIGLNILVSSFYAIFLYSSVKFWLSTGSLVGSGLVVFNTSVVLFLLTRKRQAIVTASVWNWILAPAAAVLPLLLRPVEYASLASVVVTSVGQVIGLIIMVASIAALNRSLGIVAANRGIKTGGPYAWVRHPLYAGEIVFLLSFLVSHWNCLNVLIVCAIVLFQVIRSQHEEAVLLLDERYVRYRTAVRYRLLPGVF